jgi:hypothetical protein
LDAIHGPAFRVSAGFQIILDTVESTRERGHMNKSALLGPDWQDESLEVLWAGAERAFCRLSHDGAISGRHAFIPVVSGAAHPTLESINRLAREYELKNYLDAA